MTSNSPNIPVKPKRDEAWKALNLHVAFTRVREVNPKRKMKNMNRRLIKLGEESGEFYQAYINVTSKSNPKGKTWEDVREEGIDALVPILDVLLTEMPDHLTFAAPPSAEDREKRLIDMFVNGPKRAASPKLTDDTALAFFRSCGRFVGDFLTAQHRYTPYEYEVRRNWQKFRKRGVSLARELFLMLLAEMPDQYETTVEQRAALLLELLDRKLEKWQNNRRTRRQTTEDEV